MRRGKKWLAVVRTADTRDPKSHYFRLLAEIDAFLERLAGRDATVEPNG